jgi:hypothetical protein
MAESPEELAKDVVTGAISETAAKVLDSDISKALLFPVASETGLLLAEITNAVRFYATENLERLFPKWARHREKPLTEQEFRRVMPLLQTASMESDDDMQERWARLLESVAIGRNSVLPSFGQCLAHMTPKEAGFLDRLWEEYFRFKGTQTQEWFPIEGLIDQYLSSLTLSEKDRDALDAPEVNGEKQQRADELADEGHVAVDDLVRSGILRRDFYNDVSPDEISESYQLTMYGRRFMNSVARTRDQILEDDEWGTENMNRDAW